MKKIIYIIIFLMILNIANAQEFNDYSNLEIESELYSKLTLDYKEENYKID